MECDAKRMRSGFEADSKRMRSGFEADSKRMRSGFEADAKQFRSGFEADAKRMRYELNGKRHAQTSYVVRIGRESALPGNSTSPTSPVRTFS